VEHGELRSIPVTMITVVADHRIVDGAASAAFLARVKELIENPWLVMPRQEVSARHTMKNREK